MALPAQGAGDPRPAACAARRSASPHPSPVCAVTAAAEGVPLSAPRPPGHEHHPSCPRRLRDRSRSSRPLPRRGDGHDSANSAAARGPRGPRTASSPERRRQSPHGSGTWRGGSGGAGRGLLPSSPSQRAPLPFGIHFPEKPVSSHTALPQLTPNVTELPSQTRVLAVVTSPSRCGRRILSEEIGFWGTRALSSLCPARVELL